MLVTTMVTLALVLAGLSERVASADTRGLIVPGVGVGKVRLGMSVTEVVAILGAPSSIKKDDALTAGYYWDKFLVIFGPKATDTVQSTTRIARVIAVADDRYATIGGLHVGSSVKSVLGAIGEPCVRDRRGTILDFYYRDGVVFAMVTRQGELVVVTITVQDIGDMPPASLCGR